MKIWTVTTNDDYGIETKVFTTEDAANAAARAWVEKAWGKDEEGSDPMPEAWRDAYETLSDEPGFIDSLHFDCHEVGGAETGPATHTLTDWRAEDGDPTCTATLDVTLQIGADRIDIQDETGRHLWIELEGPMMRLHVYKQERDEPVNVEVTAEAITVDHADFGTEDLRITGEAA